MWSFKKSMSLPLMGLALGALSARTASAQITDPVIFTTSFPFMVGRTLAPAGKYELRPGTDGQQVLELTGRHVAVFFEVEPRIPRQTPSNTEVVFAREGSNYVLRDVWVAGEDHGSESVTAALDQREMKREGAISERHVPARMKSQS